MKFNEDDFNDLWGSGIRHVATRQANAKLAEWLKGAPVVYGRDEPNAYWSDFKDTTDNCRGLIVCIEPLAKPECVEHEPYIKYHPSGEGVYPKFATCAKCGVQLTAKWIVRE